MATFVHFGDVCPLFSVLEENINVIYGFLFQPFFLKHIRRNFFQWRQLSTFSGQSGQISPRHQNSLVNLKEKMCQHGGRQKVASKYVKVYSKDDQF